MYKIANNLNPKLIFGLFLITILFLQSKSRAENISTSQSNLSTENKNSQVQHNDDKKIWNKTDVELLKKLADRRNLIEQQEKTIQDKQNILSIIEKNIENKIKYLEILQKKVDKFEKQTKTEENEKIKGFVKIYENMPPKNAANIFNDMEIDLLVKIISSMKEIKASSILASMNVSKSIEISNILANKVFK